MTQDYIYGFSAFELQRGSLKVRDLDEFWEEIKGPSPKIDYASTVQKLSGSARNRNRLNLRTFKGTEVFYEDSSRESTLVWSRKINPVLVIGFRFELHDLERTRQYRRVKSMVIQSVLRALELEGLENKSDSVYAVVGTIGAATLDWPEGVSAGWLHIHESKDGFLDSRILESVITDTAVEKSLLNRIANLPWQGPKSIFSAPRAARLIRQLPIEGLADWEKVNNYRNSLRESMNFDSFRKEILAASKHWWTVTGLSIATLSGLVAISGLLLLN